jgi:lysophospholipase L1-like esterase
VRKAAFKYLLFVLGTFFAFGYGVAVGVYGLFPFHHIQAIKRAITVDLGSQRQLAETAEDSDAETPGQGRNGESRIEFFEKLSPDADVAFVGDSLTEYGMWSEFFPGFRIVNRGVVRDESSDILKRLDSIDSTSPEYVFLMFGINDILRGVSVGQIVRNYDQVVSHFRDRGINVVIQSTIQCEVTRCLGKIEKVNELNALLSSYAEVNGIAFVDLGPLSDRDGLARRYTIDGLHLNFEGYSVWVEAIRPLLESLPLDMGAVRGPGQPRQGLGTVFVLSPTAVSLDVASALGHQATSRGG